MKTEQYEIWKPYVELGAAVVTILVCCCACICKWSTSCLRKTNNGQSLSKITSLIDPDSNSTKVYDALMDNTDALNNLVQSVNASTQVQLISLKAQGVEIDKLKEIEQMIPVAESVIDVPVSPNTAQENIEESGINTGDGTSLLGS